jgi:glutathione synthase/RimK-type ligase-like ATP-grasp enzyme
MDDHQVRHVALVSCRDLPEPDVDEPLLVAALKERGARVSVPAWDDPAESWERFDIAVVRSTWNYHRHPERFAEWIRDADSRTRLWNSAAAMLPNMHKRYLLQLADLGVPTVPTLLVSGDGPLDLTNRIAQREWEHVVVKPAISGGSFMTYSARNADELSAAEAAFAKRGDTDVLVQPYLSSVEEWGERSLVFVNGTLQHAVRKSPRFAGGQESVSRETVAVEDDERALAEATLAAAAELSGGAELLYARVDVARDHAGVPLLMELELIEPSLFLAQSPPTLASFAAAILAC